MTSEETWSYLYANGIDGICNACGKVVAAKSNGMPARHKDPATGDWCDPFPGGRVAKQDERRGSNL